MPRIYAPIEGHTVSWAAVDFINGAAAISSDESATPWTDAGYVADTNKHELTLLDTMTAAQLRELADYLGLTIDQGEDPDSKQTLVRTIEESFSTKYLAEVTITSTAGSTEGDTAITITGEGTYKYKTAATTAPAPYYMDDVSDWDDIETGDEFTPTSGHDKITVAEVDADGHVLGLGNDDITVNTGT